jgi:hypothetical protein
MMDPGDYTGCAGTKGRSAKHRPTALAARRTATKSFPVRRLSMHGEVVMLPNQQ